MSATSLAGPGVLRDGLACVTAVLVDSARARGFQKRARGAARVTLNEERAGTTERAVDQIALDEAARMASPRSIPGRHKSWKCADFGA